ncbi:MAG: hypothetical protein DELT_02617 [Desulfovibrio sp.]
MNKYIVPKELHDVVSEFNETIDIGKYIPEYDLDKITGVISEYAKLTYGMDQHEYVIALLVTTVHDEDKSRVVYSYLLGGEKVGESRTLSGHSANPQDHELQLPYYIFDIQDMEDFKHAMIGRGPRSFRMFIDKKDLSVLSPQQVKELQDK